MRATAEILFPEWVTLSERYRVSFRERRRFFGVVQDSARGPQCDASNFVLTDCYRTSCTRRLVLTGMIPEISFRTFRNSTY